MRRKPAGTAGLQYPRTCPCLEPVVRAVVDQNSFALIETARLEWHKFEAGGPEEVASEFFRWQDPQHVRLHLDHVPVVDEDGQRIDLPRRHPAGN